jgi:hypothetical protein
MGINISPTKMALAIPNSPREKSNSSTSFRIGESSSRCHTKVKVIYNIKMFAESKPNKPDPTKIKVVNSLATNAPRLPNIAKEIRPPSVS